MWSAGGVCAEDYSRELGALTDCEAEALAVLEAKRWADSYEQMRIPLQRLRRRAMRRYVAKHLTPTEAAEFRARIDRELGATKKTDPLSHLCCELKDRAGLSAREIVLLLEDLGAERAVGDAGAKVMRRIERVRRANRK